MKTMFIYLIMKLWNFQLNHVETSNFHFLGTPIVVNGNLGIYGGYHKIDVRKKKKFTQNFSGNWWVYKKEKNLKEKRMKFVMF